MSATSTPGAARGMLVASQAGNLLAFGLLAVQLLAVPLLTGWHQIDFIPLAGIALAICLAMILGIQYARHPLGRLVLFILDFLCMALYIYWGIVFAGPFNRLLHALFILLVCINMVAMAINVGIMVVTIRDGTFADGFAIKLRGSTPAPAALRHRKAGIVLAACLCSSVALCLLATHDFGITYVLAAPDDTVTRSSFWGPPLYNRTLVTTTITPVNDATLLVSNSTLGESPANLRPGALMYVVSVTHASTPSINYCDYNQGAESYPNGTVFLSAALPPGDATIQFVYMENVRALEYLNQTGSRIIHAMWGGHGQNMSYFESPNIFHAITATCEYQLLEHWGIPYYINIGIPGHPGFPHIFNYVTYVERGTAMVEWINATTPALEHCLGISYDFEKDNITDDSLAPQRLDIGPNPFPGLVADKGWLERNEQSPEIYRAAQAAYFGLYDLAASTGRKVYVVYQYWALEDYVDGDLDLSRLPIWKHPACEYGHMSYQDGVSGGGRHAYWEIYRNVRNQLAVYGDQGNSILTGWVDADPDSGYSRYYTNDETGFQRYLDHVKMHQAAGISEIFHAALMYLQEKWGDEAILRVHQALNEDPKETFTFRARPWSTFDGPLLDIVKNFTRPEMAIPLLASLALFFLVAPAVPRRRRG